jgi:two-component system, chemotaxis family, protein-glutamate methylesterase/glutaminase
LKSSKKYKAIIIGTSAGGLHVLTFLLQKLPADYPIPVLVVQHRAKDQRSLLEEVLQSKTNIKIKQADEKEKISGGCVYIAPPDYHLLVESDMTLSLSSDELVRYSRPAIDVLFESAAVVFREALIGIVLTGASNDGTAGIKAVAKNGGLTIAQDPAEAEYPYMPKSAVESRCVKHIWKLSQIQNFLLKLMEDQ